MMEKINLRKMPKIVPVGIGLSFFNSWVLFEEVIIDRKGIYKYLPGYQFGDACIWDLGAALLITLVLGYLYGRKRSAASTDG